MTQGWHDIWNRRIFPEDQPIDLQNLVHLDGFDSGQAESTPPTGAITLPRLFSNSVSQTVPRSMK
jgi:hypothetical protein